MKSRLCAPMIERVDEEHNGGNYVLGKGSKYRRMFNLEYYANLVMKPIQMHYEITRFVIRCNL